MKTIKFELTQTEYSLLSELIIRVQPFIQWDETLQSYADDGGILVSMDKDHFEALNKLYEDGLISRMIHGK